MPTPRRQNAAILLLFTEMLTFCGGAYGVGELIVQQVPVMLLLSAALGFLLTCALVTAAWPEVPAFVTGFCFGVLPGCTASAALALYVFGGIFGRIGSVVHPLLLIPAGSAVWALAAIPTCALFRHLLARLRRP